MTTSPSQAQPSRDTSSSASASSDAKSHQSLSSAQGTSPRIALVCDWLTTPGGAEKVLLELHHMYPDAPIYTSQYSKKGIDWFNDATVKTGWLQIFPKSLRKFLGPLRQLYFSHLDLSSYDIVISVTGAEAKSVRTQPRAQHRLTAPPTASSKAPEAASSVLEPSDPAPASIAPESPSQASSGQNTHANTANSDVFISIPGRSPEVKRLSLSQNNNHGTYHLCYCHVPTQYYWQMYDQYLANPGFGVLNPLVRLCLKLFVKPLRQADYRAAQRPDQFVTISSYAQAQIQEYYHRDAVVVAPPVEVDKFTPAPDRELHSSTFPPQSAQKSTVSPQVFHHNSAAFPPKTHSFSTESTEKSTANPTDFHKFSTSFPQATVEPPLSTEKDYYIISCRQVTWKRVDLAISACLEANIPLLVVGDGPEHANLVKLAHASPLITFLPWTPSAELACYLQGAKAYLFPSLEPFGIAAVEALAAGCPVIAYQSGGSRDFVTPPQNGLLFPEQTTASLAHAISEFQQLQFDRAAVSASAERFAPHFFRQGIKSLVKQGEPAHETT